MTPREVLLLVRHLTQLVRYGQLRFRLETFGLYYPAPQYAAPWWRISPGHLLLLLRRSGAYAKWLDEMDRIARRGSASWWDLL